MSNPPTPLQKLTDAVQRWISLTSGSPGSHVRDEVIRALATHQATAEAPTQEEPKAPANYIQVHADEAERKNKALRAAWELILEWEKSKESGLSTGDAPFIKLRHLLTDTDEVTTSRLSTWAVSQRLRRAADTVVRWHDANPGPRATPNYMVRELARALEEAP